MTDEEFFRHLHRQMEEQKKDYGLTTMRSLERRNKDKQREKNKKQTNKSKITV